MAILATLVIRARLFAADATCATRLILFIVGKDAPASRGSNLELPIAWTALAQGAIIDNAAL